MLLFHPLFSLTQLTTQHTHYSLYIKLNMCVTDKHFLSKKKCEFEIDQKKKIMQWFAYISIKLSDKTGEVIVLEVCWEQISSKLWRIPHNKAMASMTPRNNGICHRVLDHFIRLCKERCWCIRTTSRSIHLKIN